MLLTSRRAAMRGFGRIARLLGLAAALLLVAVAGAPSAWAHNEVVGSVPGDGGVIGSLPASVSVTFSEQLEPSLTDIAVTLDGSAVAGLDGPTVSGNLIEQALPATIAPGAYVLAYRVVSTDGHPVSGTLEFTVSAAASPPPAVPPPSASPPPAPATAPVSEAATEDAELAVEPDSHEDHSRAIAVAAIGIGAVLLVLVVAAGVRYRRSS